MQAFKTIQYLQYGNDRQQKAYRLLNQYGIMQHLQPFSPLLAGTIPIGIDLEGSDLDVVCHWEHPTEFRQALEVFSSCRGFYIKAKQVRGYETLIARFGLEGVPVEIFGQNRPAHRQEAFRHMLVEHRILQEKDADFKAAVIALKQQGLKTEAAFGKLLGLQGDPFKALLEMEV